VLGWYNRSSYHYLLSCADDGRQSEFPNWRPLLIHSTFDIFKPSLNWQYFIAHAL
jgi:hypothetical protein